MNDTRATTPYARYMLSFAGFASSPFLMLIGWVLMLASGVEEIEEIERVGVASPHWWIDQSASRPVTPGRTQSRIDLRITFELRDGTQRQGVVSLLPEEFDAYRTHLDNEKSVPRQRQTLLYMEDEPDRFMLYPYQRGKPNMDFFGRAIIYAGAIILIGGAFYFLFVRRER